MSKRGLSEAQIERVVHALKRRRDRVHAGNVLALAKELGISQPALWQILNRKTKPSYGTAEGLAKLEGVAVESILTGPKERAAALAREAGVPELAIRSVLDEPELDEPKPVLWWVDRMRAVALLGGVASASPAPAPVSALPTSRPRRPAA